MPSRATTNTLASILFVLASVAPSSADVSTPCTMLQKTNSYRAAFGLNAFILDQRLNNAAITHTNEMAFNCGLQHESCTVPTAWYLRVGSYYPDWIQLGENVAKNSFDENEVMGAYKRSPEHNANLLNNGFSSMGSYYYNGWWTQDFGLESPTHPDQYVQCQQDNSKAVWDGRLKKTTEESLCIDGSNGQRYDLRSQKCDASNLNQLATLIPNPSGDGSFLIYLTFKDSCVDVFGASTANGARVGLWQCTRLANQYFFFNGDGSVSPAHARGQCVELSGNGKHSPGKKVSTYQCNGGNNQKWTRSVTV